MSDTHDTASRTEEATPRRLEEARKDGDVAKSVELAQVAALAGAVAAVAIGGGALSRNLAQALTPFLAHPDAMQVGGEAGVQLAWSLAWGVLPALMAVLGAAMLAGVGGNVIQHGFLFTTAKLKPDISKISPIRGFQRLFGIDGLANFVRAALKVALTAAVAWWVLAPRSKDFPGLVTLGPADLLAFSADLGRRLVFAVLGLLALLAVIDFVWQRQRFLVRMRMTREELKEDYRQSDGDPHIRARLRQIRLERARRRMIQQVPKA